LKERNRRKGLQEQSQSFTFRGEGEESISRRKLGQSYELLNQGSRSKEDRQEGLPVRRKLQELVPGDGEGSGWERLQSIRRRLQEKRRRQEKEKENVDETILRQDEDGTGWILNELRGESVRLEDFEMRQGRERRQLMRSTSLTAPLSLRPACARSLTQSDGCCSSSGLDHNLPAAVSEFLTQNPTNSFQLFQPKFKHHVSAGSAKIQALVRSGCCHNPIS